MFTGLQTVVYGVGDIAMAKDWYSKVLGHEPYFDQPSFYVGFNVGGYELGLDRTLHLFQRQVLGVVGYWGVEDIHSSISDYLALAPKSTQRCGVDRLRQENT